MSAHRCDDEACEACFEDVLSPWERAREFLWFWFGCFAWLPYALAFPARASKGDAKIGALIEGVREPLRQPVAQLVILLIEVASAAVVSAVLHISLLAALPVAWLAITAAVALWMVQQVNS